MNFLKRISHLEAARAAQLEMNESMLGLIALLRERVLTLEQRKKPGPKPKVAASGLHLESSHDRG